MYILCMIGYVSPNIMMTNNIFDTMNIYFGGFKTGSVYCNELGCNIYCTNVSSCSLYGYECGWLHSV